MRGALLKDQRFQNARIVDDAHQRTGENQRAEPDVIRLHGGLNHQIFAEEGPERRQAHDGDKAHGHAGNRPRHLPTEAAHVLKAAAPGAQDERAGAEEEQVLHDGVIERMRQTRGGGQPGSHAQHQRHFANLPQRRIRKHALDVVLTQGHDFAENQRGRAQQGQPAAEPVQTEGGSDASFDGFRHAAGLTVDDQDDAEDPHLGDDAGKRTGHRRRRGRVRIGQPGMEGHKTGLDGKADKAEQNGGLRGPDAQLRRGGGNGRQQGVAPAQQHETGQHETGAARAHDIILEARIMRGAVIFMHDKEVGGKGHQLPVAVQRAHVRSGHDARQRGEGQEQEEPVPALALGVRHIAHGVDGDNQRHQRNDDEEEFRRRHGMRFVDDGGKGQQSGDTAQEFRAAHLEPEGQPHDESAAIKHPESGMHGRMRRGVSGKRGGHVEHGAAQQAHARHEHGQQPGQEARPDIAVAIAIRGSQRRGFKPDDTQHLHMQGNKNGGTHRFNKQHHQRAGRSERQRRHQHALRDAGARLGHQEGRSAHGRHQAEHKKQRGFAAGAARTAKGLHAHIAASLRQHPQSPQGQQTGNRLKQQKQPYPGKGRSSGCAESDAEQARVMQRAPVNQASCIMPLPHGKPGARQQKKKPRQVQKGRTRSQRRIKHTRP